MKAPSSPPESRPPRNAAPRVTRRRFLAATATVVAGGMAGIAVFDWFGLRNAARWYRRGVENYATAHSWAFLEPADRIRRHFDYLTIDEEGLQRFVAAFEKRHGKVSPRATDANRLMYTKFLLSTDFFHNGADESKLVRYIALCDPYVSPCYIPFPPVSG